MTRCYIGVLVSLTISLLLSPTSGEEPAGEAGVLGEAAEAGTLFSPRIADNLRSKLIDADDTRQVKTSIMIEFKGGNSGAIKDFREDPISRQATSRGERIAALVAKLEEHARKSQKKVIAYLESKKVEYMPLWSVNEIYVKSVTSRTIAELAYKFKNIARVRQVILVHPPKPAKQQPSKPRQNTVPSSHKFSAEVPEHIRQVNARCSNIKCLGEGVVIAILDDGVSHTHVELRENFREEYGWFDPIEESLTPRTTASHGTHVAGIAVGKTKGSAPKAQWIACLMFRVDITEEVYLKACAEWALCPFKPDKTGRDCSKAPHIINNSWTINSKEQQEIPRDVFYGIQAAWNEAGIISYFAAGNTGPYCTSIDPPGMYDISFSVAAIDNTSTVAWWSSRGPVLNMERPGQITSDFGTCKTACPKGELYNAGYGNYVCTLTKPDISAPGVRINSSMSYTDTSYGLDSGTSMSSPLVAGIAALMICANNQNNKKTKLNWMTAGEILKKTARTDRINLAEGRATNQISNHAWTSNLLCNIALSDSCGTYPNNLYGWGEVDACAAVKEVLKRA